MCNLSFSAFVEAKQRTTTRKIHIHTLYLSFAHCSPNTWKNRTLNRTYNKKLNIFFQEGEKRWRERHRWWRAAEKASLSRSIRSSMSYAAEKCMQKSCRLSGRTRSTVLTLAKCPDGVEIANKGLVDSGNWVLMLPVETWLREGNIECLRVARSNDFIYTIPSGFVCCALREDCESWRNRSFGKF